LEKERGDEREARRGGVKGEWRDTEKMRETKKVREVMRGGGEKGRSRRKGVRRKKNTYERARKRNHMIFSLQRESPLRGM